MKILNVRIDPVTRAEAVIALKNKQLIFTPNPEILLEARENKSFRGDLNRGSLMLADGHGLLFVSTMMKIKSKFWRFLLYFPALLLFLIWKAPFKKQIPEIIHGADFMETIIEWAVMNEKSVFFLGAGPGVAEKTANFFRDKYKNLKVAGFSDEDPGHNAFELVRKLMPNVLFVAYGAPKQEMWLAKYAHKLQNLDVAMAVGGSFDFWSGNTKRAPHWMRKLGLEWLWRLFLNPKQRVKRIWNAFIKFPFISLFSS